MEKSAGLLVGVSTFETDLVSSLTTLKCCSMVPRIQLYITMSSASSSSFPSSPSTAIRERTVKSIIACLLVRNGKSKMVKKNGEQEKKK